MRLWFSRILDRGSVWKEKKASIHTFRKCPWVNKEGGGGGTGVAAA